MVKLKSEVKGFIYENQFGTVIKIFTENFNDKELDLISKVIGEYDIWVDNSNVNELFEITSKESLENDEEGLNKVLEWVDSTAPEYGMFIDDNEWEKEMGR
jgi:hypothetical protein